MERNVNNDKRLKPLSCKALSCRRGCKLQKQTLSENSPCDYKVFPYYLEATTRHSERSEESNRKLNQESKNIICHPEETQCPKDLRVSKDSSVVPLLQNDDLMCHPESLYVILSESKDSVQKLTKCQVLNGGMLSQKQSFCVQYKN